MSNWKLKARRRDGNGEAVHLRVDPKCSAPQVFDQYARVSFTEERQHLDQLAKYLKDAAQNQSLTSLATPGEARAFHEAQWRVDRAKRYLVEKHKVANDRIVTWMVVFARTGTLTYSFSVTVAVGLCQVLLC